MVLGAQFVHKKKLPTQTQTKDALEAVKGKFSTCYDYVIYGIKDKGGGGLT